MLKLNSRRLVSSGAVSFLFFVATCPAEVLRVKSGVTGTATGDSWNNAYSELSTALASAISGDEIWVASGIYKPTAGNDRLISFQLKPNVAIYGGFSGNEEMRSLRNSDPDTNGTILSGDLSGDDEPEFAKRVDNSLNVVTATDITEPTTLDGFTITGGSGSRNFSNVYSSDGSGLRADSSSLVLSNLRWLDNDAVSGGGAYFYQSTVNLKSSDFISNRCDQGQRAGGLAVFDSIVVMDDCEFSDNIAESGGGLVVYRSELKASRVLFSENRARFGAGLLIDEFSTGQLWNSRFARNESEFGAISISDSNLAIINSLFVANSGRDIGVSTSSSNTEQPSQIRIISSTFYEDSSDDPDSPYLTIYTDNASSLTLQNSIIWNPLQNEAVSPLKGGDPTPETCCNLIAGGLEGYADILAVDPRFVSPMGADGILGTDDDDFNLTADSPAVGIGDPTLLPADLLDLDGDGDLMERVSFDLNNRSRVRNPGLELGAYERQPLSFQPADVRLVAGTGGVIVIPNWTRAGPNGGGLIYDLVRISGPQALGFTTPPMVDSDGNLSFALMSGRTGSALFQATVSDPDHPGDPLVSEVFTISVGQKVIRVDLSATGANDGFSWTSAIPNLEDALSISRHGDQIWLADGIHKPRGSDGERSFVIPDGISIYGGFTGSESSLAERNGDPLTNGTILDGDLLGDDVGFKNRDDNVRHVVVLENIGSSTILDGFTIRGGEATDPNEENSRGRKGGGILSSGSPIFRNLNFASNRAIDGGALASLEGGPRILSCRFEGNIAENTGGAALLLEALHDDHSEILIVDDCRFVGNQAKDGGAIQNFRDLTLIRSSRFEDNTATLGGSLSLRGGSPDVIECVFIRNQAQFGGAIAASNFDGNLINLSFLGNHATTYGGACTFSSTSSEFLMANCLFSGNTAVVEGGAIRLSGPKMKMMNCTLSGNSAPKGGGLLIRPEDTVQIENSILWGNGFNGVQTEISPPSPKLMTDGGRLLIRGGLSDRSDILLTDPGFRNPLGPDGIVGTEDDDLTPTAGFVPIDASPTNLLPEDQWDLDGDGNLTEPLPLDLSGQLRLVGSRVDLGAYENQSPSIHFPDVRLASTPAGVVVIPSWIFADPVSPPAFLASLEEASGTIIFEALPEISANGDLTFELAQGTSGWTKIKVQIDRGEGFKTEGNFHLIVSPVVHFVSAEALSNGSGTSWDAPLTLLSDALEYASRGDEIRVAAGTYYPAGSPDPRSTFLLKGDVTIRGGYDGTESNGVPTHPTAVLTRTVLSGKFSNPQTFLPDANNVVTADRLSSPVVLESVVVTGGLAGSAAGGELIGGGIYCNQSSSVILRNLAVLKNRSSDRGGAIYVKYSDVLIDSCFIGNNSSREGGGIYFGQDSSARIRNSIISGNRALEEGGGAYIGFGISKDIFFQNCTITNNTCRINGGGIGGNRNVATAFNCLLWGNTDGAGNSNESTVRGRNIFASGSISNSIVRGGVQDLLPPLVFDTDPLFVNPTGSDRTAGTLDDDVRLLVSSPAINAGDGSLLPAGVTTDFLNQPRIVGEGLDIGAIEGAQFANFELLNPGLEPEGDENLNGLTNFFDYASGGDPRSRHDPSLLPLLQGNQLTVSLRNNSDDLSPVYQTSTDLSAWTDLVKDVDYTFSLPVIREGGRDLFTLELLDVPEDSRRFFRQILRSDGG